MSLNVYRLDATNAYQVLRRLGVVLDNLNLVVFVVTCLLVSIINNRM
jgi:hypothetical protein